MSIPPPVITRRTLTLATVATAVADRAASAQPGSAVAEVPAPAKPGVKMAVQLSVNGQAHALDVDPRTSTVGDKLVAALDRTFGPAETKNPAKLLPFIRQGRKLIIYHGTSDPAIPAARSVLFYKDLTALLGSPAKAAANVRLFLVPGMQHCSGGVGPDQFDTLSAIEAGVEKSQAPDAIGASTKADSSAPHSLPLCPYPKQARYSGTGAMTDGTNWRCVAPAQRVALQ